MIEKLDHQRVVIQVGVVRQDAVLVLAGDELLAVFVFLDPHIYENDSFLAGKWSVEVGFGPCFVGTSTMLFDDLEAATAWAWGEYSKSRV